MEAATRIWWSARVMLIVGCISAMSFLIMAILVSFGFVKPDGFIGPLAGSAAIALMLTMAGMAGDRLYTELTTKKKSPQ